MIPIGSGGGSRRNADCVIVSDRLYIFPVSPRWALLCVDLNNRTVDEISCFSEWAKKQNELNEEGIVFARNICSGEEIFLGVYQGSSVVRYNTKDRTTDLIKLPVGNIFSLFRLGGSNWLATLSGNIVYKMDDGWDIAESYELPFQRGYYKRGINELLQIGGAVFALPAEASKIMKLDHFGNVFRDWREYPDGFEFYEGENIKFFRYAVIDEKAYLFSRNNNAVLLIDEKKDNLEIAWKNDFNLEEYWKENPNHLKRITFKEHLLDGIHVEDRLIGVEQFLEALE